MICTQQYSLQHYFTVAKICKQPKYALTDECINKMENIYKYTYKHTHTHIYTYNGILLSHKKLNHAICDNMDKSKGYYPK